MSWLNKTYANSNKSKLRTELDLGAVPLVSLSTEIPKVTFVRLRLIAQRIQNVLLTRSACAAWIAFAIATLIGIVIDGSFSLPMLGRWLMTFSILSVGVVSFCYAYFPRARRLASPMWLARVIESNAPVLRNRLLSSLELAAMPLLTRLRQERSLVLTPLTTGIRVGSVDFVDALQMQVAARIETVAPKHILRWSSIRNWILAAILLAMICSLAFFIPGISFGRRVGRVLFPSANIGRVAAYELVIITPADPWIEVRSDLFAVKARSIVGTPTELTLQVLTGDEPVKEIVMHPSEREDNEFVQNISLSGDYAKLRVVAEQSESSWYELRIVDRPVVAPKSLLLRFPEYAQLPPLQVTPWDGTIEAVTGTTATLQFSADKELSSSQLIVERDIAARSRVIQNDARNQPEVVTLYRGKNGTLDGDLTIASNAYYSIRAQDADTGKETDHARKYQIVALEDKPPMLEWAHDSPHSPQYVSSQDILPLKVVFSDEFPLAQAAVQWRIENSPWNDVVLDLPEERSGALEWMLDPISLQGEMAELIEVRFSATDRLAQTTTSAITQWVISESYVSADRWQVLEGRLLLAKTSMEQGSQWKGWAEHVRTVSNENQDLASQALAKFPSDRGTLDKMRAIVLTLIPASNDFAEQDALIDLEHALNALVTFEIPRYLNLAKNLPGQSSDGTKQSDAFEHVKNEANHLANRFVSLDRSIRMLLGEDVMNAAGQDMVSIIESQSIFEQTLGSMNAEQIQNRQAAIGGILGRLLTRLTNFATVFDDGEKTALQSHLRNLKQIHSSILLTTNRGVLQNKSYWDSEESRRWIRQNGERFKQYDRLYSSVGQFSNLHRESRKATRHQYAAWIDGMQTIQALLDSLQSASDASETLLLVERLQLATDALQESLKGTREAELLRTSINRYYVSDVGNIRRAIENILSAGFGDRPEVKRALAEVSEASKMLILSHRLKLVEDMNGAFLEIESSSDSPEIILRSIQPRNYEELIFQVERTREGLDLKPIDDETKQQFNAMSWGPLVQVIGQTISPRRWSKDTIQRMAASMREYGELLQNTMLMLEPPAEEARRTIAKYVPAISQLAKEAADAASKTKEAMSKKETVPDSLEKLEKDTQKKIDQLKEGLQDVANVQDLLDEEQADLARDADAALEAIEEASAKAAESMKRSQAPEQQQSAMQDQQSLEELLTKVGEHFEKVEQAREQSEEPNYGELADELGESSQKPADNVEEYEEASFLREVALMTPEDILRQLEAKLKERTEMQADLKKISEQTAKQSDATIQSLAQKQRELQRELEQSDALIRAAKQAAVDRMQQVARHASKLGDQEMSWIQQSASRAQLAESQESINKVRNEVRSAAQQIYQLSSDDAVADIADKVASIQEKLQTVLENFEDETGKIQNAEDKLPAQEPRQLSNLQREASDWQKRFRRDKENWLKGETNHRTNHERNLQRQVENEQKSLDRSLEKLDQQRKRFEQSKKEAHDYHQLQNAENQVAIDQTELDGVRLRAAAASEMLNDVERMSEQLQSLETSELSSNDRHLELAKQLSQETVDEVRTLVAEAIRIDEQLNALQAPLTQRNSAELVAMKEQAMINDLLRTGKDFARVGRHSARLEQEGMSEKLEALKTAAEKVAQGAMKEVVDGLTQNLKKSDPNVLPPARLTEQASEAVTKSLAKSEDFLKQIEARSETTLEALSNATPRARAEPTEASSGKAPSFSDYLTDSEMARLLDDLDRVIYDSEKANEEEANEQGQQNQSNSGQSSGSSQSSGKQGSSQSASNGQRDSQGAQKGKEAMQSSADKLADMLAQKRTKPEPPKSGQSSANAASRQKSAQSTGTSTASAAGDIESKYSAGGSIEVPEQSEGDGNAKNDWAKLRESQLEDVSSERRADRNSPHQESIDAYFRALSRLRVSP